MSLAGITPSKCPTACKADRCVITERGFCGHPYKGALQGPDKDSTATLDRWQAARVHLAGSKLHVSD